ALSVGRSRRAIVSGKNGYGLLGVEPTFRCDDRQVAVQSCRQATGDRADTEFLSGPLRRQAQSGGGGPGAYFLRATAAGRAAPQHPRQRQRKLRPPAPVLR